MSRVIRQVIFQMYGCSVESSEESGPCAFMIICTFTGASGVPSVTSPRATSELFQCRTLLQGMAANFAPKWEKR